MSIEAQVNERTPFLRCNTKPCNTTMRSCTALHCPQQGSSKHDESHHHICAQNQPSRAERNVLDKDVTYSDPTITAAANPTIHQHVNASHPSQHQGSNQRRATRKNVTAVSQRPAHSSPCARSDTAARIASPNIACVLHPAQGPGCFSTSHSALRLPVNLVSRAGPANENGLTAHGRGARRERQRLPGFAGACVRPRCHRVSACMMMAVEALLCSSSSACEERAARMCCAGCML